MSDLPLLTPVVINIGAGKPELFGVICFGPSSVKFSSGDNWVGCRLTSTSLGAGKNDGSVLGVRYFDAGGETNGVFVRSTQVKRREGMTKLDELKLKREIAKFSHLVGGATATIAKNKYVSTQAALVKPKESAVIPDSLPASTVSDKPLTRLEQLKQRRAKLAQQQRTGGEKTPPASRSSSRSPTRGSSRMDELKKQKEDAKTRQQEVNPTAAEGKAPTAEIEIGDETQTEDDSASRADSKLASVAESEKFSGSSITPSAITETPQSESRLAATLEELTALKFVCEKQREKLSTNTAKMSLIEEENKRLTEER